MPRKVWDVERRTDMITTPYEVRLSGCRYESRLLREKVLKKPDYTSHGEFYVLALRGRPRSIRVLPGARMISRQATEKV